MTPILHNRHEKVQEASINLIGRIGECLHFDCFGHCINCRSSLIADCSAEFVPAREWMRICFELLDLLKAHNDPSPGTTTLNFWQV
jgi:splicing factor 3B subunit 1